MNAIERFFASVICLLNKVINSRKISKQTLNVIAYMLTFALASDVLLITMSVFMVYVLKVVVAG